MPPPLTLFNAITSLFSILFNLYTFILETAQLTLQASGQWNVNALTSKYADITPEVVQTYLQLGRFEFDCGNYQTARDILRHYISLYAHAPVPTTEVVDEDLVAAGVDTETTKHTHGSGGSDKDLGNPQLYYLKSINSDMLHVLWGRLACEIMVQDWTAASVAVEAVKVGMEMMVSNHHMSPLEALQQRTWLMHWSLFVYWNVQGGLEQLVDLFHTERFRQAITIYAPHLLRYLTAAVLLCKRRVQKSLSTEARRLMRSLVYVMQDCEYSDPIVEFVNCLCVKFDFDSAHTKLAECEKVLAADFFLCEQKNIFMEEARVFVFENYCRIHNKIDLRALGEKLAMDQEQAERWIVDLIRNADLDAKIQAEEGCVIMGSTQLSMYEQVVEKTRDLNVRSATLAANLNHLWNEVRKEKSTRQRANMED
jgi:translation initiation factor 3 subunit E